MDNYLSFYIIFADFEYQEPQIRLHRSIIEILKDRTTLSFLVQFLETKNGLSLVKFWLDCEALKTLSSDGKTSTIRTENCNGKDKNCVSSPTTSCSENNKVEGTETRENDEIDNAKVSNKQLIDSMTQSLTDDEKSKLYCEKNQKRNKKTPPSIQEDALGIYRKYLVIDSVDSIELPATILSKLSLALCDSQSDSDTGDNSTLWQAFDDAQKHVMDVMEKHFLKNFLESSFYSKYTVDVLTSESLNLNEILRNETTLFFFIQFLEQEDRCNCKLPYLEFWISATNFHKQSDQTLQQMKSDAVIIYEKWFSLQATSSLKISNRVRTKVEEMICSADAETIQRSFDIPIKIVEIYLENSLKKFLKSELFHNHLCDVMVKAEGHERSAIVGNNGILKRSISISSSISAIGQHRRTRSELTKSISAQNTLLAGLDHRKSAKNTADLHIDARQLDPDMLWRRKCSNGGLSFGRVDELGRYERGFELPTEKSPIPQSKSAFQLKSHSIDVDDPQSIVELTQSGAQSKFKNVMRKFVHLQDDEMQQEIAWQVAEMIVKDVTKITLSTGDNEI